MRILGGERQHAEAEHTDGVTLWDVGDSIEGVLRAGGPIDPAALADTDIDLDSGASTAGS